MPIDGPTLFPRLSRGRLATAMVVLEYAASANAQAPRLPTYSNAPFFYDRVEGSSGGIPELTDGALLANAKHTQPHSRPNVSYYYTAGVSDYVRRATHTALW